MNFVSEYKIYSKIKLDCTLGPDISVEKIMYGLGGSHNIIVKAKFKSRILIIKIFPLDAYHNTKLTPNFNKLEIKFYQFLTQKFLLTKRTPHIVGIYSYRHCSYIQPLIKKLLHKPCLSYSDQLMTQISKQSESDKHLCDILLRKEMKLIMEDFDMALIEYCETDVTSFIKQYLIKIKKSKSPKYILGMVYGLHIIIFQIIFTLGIIKDAYPGFLHGDFFLRNILLQNIQSFGQTDYVAYHFKNKIFYLPANGPNAKINDRPGRVSEHDPGGGDLPARRVRRSAPEKPIAPGQAEGGLADCVRHRRGRHWAGCGAPSSQSSRRSGPRPTCWWPAATAPSCSASST